ncbi:hypothetical protein ACFQ2B_26355 [Streptomyces stramineus]
MAGSLARRRLLGAGAALGAAAVAGPLAPLARAQGTGGAWPTSFPLPVGFRPEGIATGPGPYAWFGSLGGGSVYRASLATGRGTVIPTGTDTPTIGLKSDHRGRLFLAGGPTRLLRVVAGATGAALATYEVGGPRPSSTTWCSPPGRLVHRLHPVAALRPAARPAR